MEDAWTKPGDEVINYFKSDIETGLSDEQVARNQEKYGPNGKSQFILCLYIFHWSDGVDKLALRVGQPGHYVITLGDTLPL